MLPHSHLAPVGQCISAECLVGCLQRQDVIVAVGFLSPLHAVHRVGKNLVACFYECLVLGTLVIRIVGVLLAEAVVVVYEIYRTERSVLPYLAHHASYAVAVVGIVLCRYGDTVVSHGYQLAALRYVPSHALVHYRLEVLCHHSRPCRLGEAVGHVVGREQLCGLAPCIPVC